MGRIDHHNGQGHNNDDGKRQIDPRHHDKRADDGDDGEKEILRTVVGKL